MFALGERKLLRPNALGPNHQKNQLFHIMENAATTCKYQQTIKMIHHSEEGLGTNKSSKTLQTKLHQPIRI